jgi:hypothetical protein
VTTALLCGAGYIIAIASVMVISGGFFSMMLQFYFNVSIPWIIFSAIFTAGAMAMMFRGASRCRPGWPATSSASSSLCCWSYPSPR